jgi:O-antigen/teichoic acid export membrane protein
MFQETAVKKHIPLLIMMAGVACQLASSVVLYEILDPDTYAKYAYWITSITIVFSFGLLGLEQTLLRSAEFNGVAINIPRNVALYLLFCSIVGPIVISLFLSVYWGQEGWAIYLLSIASVAVMFSYNFFRLIHSFVKAQVVNNIWRLLLVLPVFIGVSAEINENQLIGLLIISMLVGVAVAIFYFMRSNIIIILADNLVNINSLSLSFIFSMAVLTGLNFFDRIVIGGGEGEEFGRYFLIYNIFFSPLSVIATYIGFKKLILYKNNFSIGELHRSIVYLLFLFVPGVILYSALVIGIENFLNLGFNLGEDLNIVIPMLVLGCVRLCYAELSAVMGSRGSKSGIWLSNIASLAVLALIFFYVEQLVDVEVVLVAWLSCVLWLLRTIFYYLGVRRIEY